MLFESVSPSYYPYISGFSIALMILCFSFFLKGENIPRGNFKDIFHGAIFAAFIGILPLALLSLPIPPSGTGLILKFSSCWYALFPALLYLIVFYRTHRYQIHYRIILFAALFSFLAAFLIPDILKPALIFLFLPILVGVIISIVWEYEKSLNRGFRNFLFHFAFGIAIAGAGFYADALLLGKYQEIPLLTLSGALWGLFIIGGKIIRPEDEDPKLSQALPYILIPFTILTLVGIFKFFEAYFIAAGNPLWMSRYQLIFSLILAGSTAVTISNIRRRGEFLLDSLVDRFMDPLSRKIYRLRNRGGEKSVDLENFLELVQTLPGIHSVIWRRKRHSNRYLPANPQNFPDFEKWNHLKISSAITKKFSIEGFILITPLRGDEYIPSMEPSGEIFSLVDNHDLLLTPAGNFQNPDYLPAACVSFIPKDSSRFTTGEIRSLTSLGTLLKIENEKGNFENLLNALNPAKTPEELNNLLNQNFSSFFQDCEIKLSLVNSADGGRSKTFTLKEEKIDSAGLFPIKGEKFRKFLPLQYGENLLILQVPEKDFTYEIEDRERFAALALRISLILERISTYKNYQNQISDLERNITKAEEELTSQSHKTAQDIHDTIAQDIYAAKIQMGIIEKTLQNKSPETMEEFDNLKSTVNEALKNIRALITEFRNPKDQTLRDLSANLQEIIDRLKREKGTQMTCQGLEFLNNLKKEPQKDISLIIREGLNNIAKHAEAKHAALRIKKREKCLHIIIADDGTGFKKEKPSESEGGFGMTSMKSRADRHNCKFQIRTKTDKGTLIRIICPKNTLN